MKYILYGAAKYMREHIDDEKIKYFDYIVDNSAEKIEERLNLLMYC